ncbi:hypothetical protein TNCT_340881, partial [Trichonephila clavata]
ELIKDDYRRIQKTPLPPSRLNLLILLILVCGCSCAFNRSTIEEEMFNVFDLFLSITNITVFIVMFLGLCTLYEWIFYHITTLNSVSSVQEDSRTAVVENEHRTLTAIGDADKRVASTNTDFSEFVTELVQEPIGESECYPKDQAARVDTCLRQRAAKYDTFMRNETMKNFSYLTKQAAKNDNFIRMQIAKRCDYLRKRAGKNLNFIRSQSGQNINANE